MSDKFQYKSFTSRRFRADLHYRLKLLAATQERTMEEILNEALELGLIQLEKAVYGAVGESGGE